MVLINMRARRKARGHEEGKRRRNLSAADVTLPGLTARCMYVQGAERRRRLGEKWLQQEAGRHARARRCSFCVHVGYRMRAIR